MSSNQETITNDNNNKEYENYLSALNNHSSCIRANLNNAHKEIEYNSYNMDVNLQSICVNERTKVIDAKALL